MTREQEEVIAAARRYASQHYKPFDDCPPYSENNKRWRAMIAAVRALEESEKPKPKVWTISGEAVLCSDDKLGAKISQCSTGTRERICAALNVYEQLNVSACKCGVREYCCTCKST